jgi:hypothetical protein
MKSSQPTGERRQGGSAEAKIEIKIVIKIRS